VFWLALTLVGERLKPWDILVCTAIARAVSSFVNFNINRRLVFRRKTAYGLHARRYYMLAAAQMLVSAAFVWLISKLGGPAAASGFLIAVKALVDVTLFFFSYAIQRNWVFKD
jgi:putative flippase GtrA